MTARPSEEQQVQGCTGHRDCLARLHIHGCSADFGTCGSPEQHVAEPTWRENWRRQNAVAAIDKARRRVMDLHGGNLDHPALDHLEAAVASVLAGRSEQSMTTRPSTTTGGRQVTPPAR